MVERSSSGCWRGGTRKRGSVSSQLKDRRSGDNLAVGTAARFDADGEALYTVHDTARLLGLKTAESEELAAVGADAANLRVTGATVQYRRTILPLLVVRGS